jgi:hypothetical protein
MFVDFSKGIKRAGLFCRKSLFFSSYKSKVFVSTSGIFNSIISIFFISFILCNSFFDSIAFIKRVKLPGFEAYSEGTELGVSWKYKRHYIRKGWCLGRVLEGKA